MTSRRWDDDDQLLHDLGEALRAPGTLTDRIRRLGTEAYAWRGIDEELEFAGLVFDSALEATAGVRAAPLSTPRSVRFESGAVCVHLERAGDLLVGQVVPAGPGTLSMITAGGTTTTVEVDELGCFTIDGPPAEPVRLTWRTPTTGLITDWIRF